MIIQVYKSPSEGTVTALPHGASTAMNLLEDDAVLIYQIQAPTWEDAMTEHHKRQGWQPYIPMDTYDYLGFQMDRLV